jgi:hypothetical protein
MGIKKDYLLKQIAQLVEGMARAVIKRKKQGAPEAVLTIDDLLHDLLQLSPEVTERLDASSLLAMLTPAGELDAHRAGMLGLLLRDKATYLEDDEPERAAALAAKSETLLEHAYEAGFELPESVDDG